MTEKNTPGSIVSLVSEALVQCSPERSRRLSEVQYWNARARLWTLERSQVCRSRISNDWQ